MFSCIAELLSCGLYGTTEQITDLNDTAWLLPSLKQGLGWSKLQLFLVVRSLNEFFCVTMLRFFRVQVSLIIPGSAKGIYSQGYKKFSKGILQVYCKFIFDLLLGRKKCVEKNWWACHFFALESFQSSASGSLGQPRAASGSLEALLLAWKDLRHDWHISS